MALKQITVQAKLKAYGITALVLLLMTATAAYQNNLEERYQVHYLALSSQLLMLSQRFAKEAEQSLSGNPAVFAELAQSEKTVADIVTRLDKGDDIVPPTSGEPREALDELMKVTEATLRDAKALESGRTVLVKLGETVAAINKSTAELRKISQALRDTYTGAQREQATLFALATVRIGKDAGIAMGQDVTTEQVVGLAALERAAEESLAALPVSDPSVMRAKALINTYHGNIDILVTQAGSLVAAKKAAADIVADSNRMLEAAERLEKSYEASTSGAGIIAVVLFALLLLALGLFSKTYLDDTKLRAETAMRINRQNQDGILRLMNELSDLAEGDLTVRATVSEDITGAIADSVNYTTEEFRKLVTGIKAAEEQMERATKDAEDISKGLLQATEKQAQDIQSAGEAVQLMTQSIQEVDTSAAQSASVARRTLEVTQKGAQAVRNTISGMDGIREQIQDTAKRIKRLGESSQEIGEIVDLISDITEQTNVLALNAAIQAASAGEAGRGFSVVAEEVQRLAERSAEATKQIGGLVKAIQGDTHDAVAAMEKSILGVVEGAVLTDMAGQSLKEIEQVSNELATLINSISVSTQVQTDMASEVAGVMKEILQITVETTEGTQLTANSIAQLAKLTSGLRGSISGFKL